MVLPAPDRDVRFMHLCLYSCRNAGVLKQVHTCRIQPGTSAAPQNHRGTSSIVRPSPAAVNGRVAISNGRPAGSGNTQIRCVCENQVDRANMIQCEVRAPIPLQSALPIAFRKDNLERWRRERAAACGSTASAWAWPGAACRSTFSARRAALRLRTPFGGRPAGQSFPRRACWRVPACRGECSVPNIWEFCCRDVCTYRCCEATFT